MKRALQISVALVGFLMASISLNAQIDVKGKAKDAATDRANQKVDDGINKGLDGVENGIKGLFKKKKKDSSSETKSTKQNVVKNNATADTTSPSTEKTSLQSYSKFDFIPGEKIIFFDDFSQDAIGDFPLFWNTNGSAEVVNTNLFGGKWLKFSMDESLWSEKFLNLPENYTIEFDVVPLKTNDEEMKGYCFRLIQSEKENSFDYGAVPGKAGFAFFTEYSGRQGYRTYVNDENNGSDVSGNKDEENTFQKSDVKYHMSIWVQKTRIRVYQDQIKIFDLPRAFAANTKANRIRFEEGAAMLSNVRIAIGAPDTRSKLITEGKLVSYGIYFDVNKDIVKPESYATLKSIADVLKENPGVRVKIIGHTDSDGSDAANLDLSKRRANSVKNELVKTFGIEASRLEFDGMGESKPIAPNDNSSNKALNRRVEFIKL